MQFRLSRLAYAVVVFVVIPAIGTYTFQSVKSGEWVSTVGGFWGATLCAVTFITASLARIVDMHVCYCKSAFWGLVITLFFPVVALILIPAFVYFYKPGKPGESVIDAMRGRGTVEF